ILLALKRTRDDGWTGRPVLLIAAFAAVAFFAFARHEVRALEPLLPLGLFREPAFVFGVVGATLLYTVTYVLSYTLPFQLEDRCGLSAARAGAFMTAQPATMALVAPLSGVVADRWGPRLPSSVGMLAIAVGMACLSITAASPDARLVLSLALVGVGAGL